MQQSNYGMLFKETKCKQEVKNLPRCHPLPRSLSSLQQPEPEKRNNINKSIYKQQPVAIEEGSKRWSEGREQPRPRHGQARHGHSWRREREGPWPATGQSGPAASEPARSVARWADRGGATAFRCRRCAEQRGNAGQRVRGRCSHDESKGDSTETTNFDGGQSQGGSGGSNGEGETRKGLGVGFSEAGQVLKRGGRAGDEHLASNDGDGRRRAPERWEGNPLAHGWALGLTSPPRLDLVSRAASRDPAKSRPPDAVLVACRGAPRGV